MSKNTTVQSHLHWFRNASPYINLHRGRTFVLAFGGEALLEADFASLIHDIALLHSLGIRLVLVHGVRPQVENLLATAGLQARVHQGLRVTDAPAMAAVQQAVGSVRVEIEARLSLGLPNTPMSGARLRVISGNLVAARPHGIHDGVDFQHTGKVRRVDTEAIHQSLGLGHIVLLSPLGYAATGEVFNLLAEEVATEAAIALHADKLIFMTEPGARLRDGRRRLITQIDPGAAQALLERRHLDEAMRLHLASAIRACGLGVGRVHLIERSDGALLQELYTRDGAGTLVTQEIVESLRAARVDDIGGILEIIQPLEQQGVLVRRSREQLELEIAHFTVAEKDGAIIACAALYPFPDEGVAELACIAIHPDYKNQHWGARLLAHLEKRAAHAGIRRLFVLTTQTAHWFREHGFVNAGTQDLPLRRQALYNYKRNSKVFIKPLVS